jgi:hypothetical protein
MHILAGSAFLFALAVLFAVFEVEAEGKYGWGEKFPTWYRTRGFVAKLYGTITSKPLTGYHAALFFVPILIFFWPMVSTSTLSWAGTLSAFSDYFAWVVLWDFCWFILNPYYGIKRFRRKYVWWFSKEPWIAGRVPLGYINAWVMSLFLAAASGALESGAEQALTDRIYQLGLYLVGLFFLAKLGRPLYLRYYRKMRRRDERNLAGIFHR